MPAQPLPPQLLIDQQAPWTQVQRGVRVLQGAFALTFVIGLLNGALSTQRMELIRSGARASEMLASQMPLMITGQVLYWATMVGVLFGLYCLTQAPAATRAPGMAWATLSLLSVDAVLELAPRFVPPLQELLYQPSLIQATALLGTALHLAAFICLVESLRRLEAAAGGRRVAELRAAFFSALAVRYVVGWAGALLPAGEVLGVALSMGWGMFAFRQIAAAASYGLLIWMLEHAHAATVTRRATLAAGGADVAAAPARSGPPGGLRDMVVGGVVFSIGTIVTVLSYSAAREGGGRYVVAYGAVLFGLVQFFRGLARSAGG